LQDWQQDILFINSHPEKHLQRAKKTVQGKPTYICPLCGNGSGSEGDGITTKDDIHYKCFKCGFYGDMIQLIAEENGITDPNSREAIDAARRAWGITVPAQTTRREETKKKPMDLSYLQARGISQGTAERLGFKYNPDKRSIVIPVQTEDQESYIERLTEPQQSGIRYQIPKGTKSGLFNLGALAAGTPVFITEGAIDAASIEEVGGHAVGLNSTSNTGLLIRYLEKHRPRIDLFIIALDNDEAGRQGAGTLSKGLQDLGYRWKSYPLKDGYKDVNDALIDNRKDFERSIAEAAAPQPAAEQEEIESRKVKALLPIFKEYIQDQRNNKAIPTGFERFDKAIGGGLLPRFYIIGAVTSLGKTALVMQIADQIAKAGTDVLIFSLEMGKEELIARSISRETYIASIDKTGKTDLAKTELGIIMPQRYAGYSQDEKKVIAAAYEKYAEYAGDRISIYEGKHTADEIQQKVDKYISFTGRKPVVIVDYLQIIQPPAELRRASTKEQVDYSIDVFTAIRRDKKVPVIGISSFNRSNYTTVADGSSFKESGSIEYSGDTVITLELDIDRPSKGSDGAQQNKMRELIKEAMRADPREIKLTFQKNRGNRVGSVIYFRYFPKFNFFEEDWTRGDHEL